ncbi:MAG: hypothetical protein LBR77_10995 [Lachnospiraceae bacterium]|jgi:hypothetical protein|nr:hypothetical protein [Lachnospiraceae bacterium]
MAKNTPKNVVKYRRPHNINVGVVVFVIILLYIAINVYVYFAKEKIQFYEVTEGSIVKNRFCTGLILRDEEVGYAPESGNVILSVKDGTRASVGALLYSIDETGRLDQYLKDMEITGTMSGTDGAEQAAKLSQIRKSLTTYRYNYSDGEFMAVYNMKSNLEATMSAYTGSYLEGIIGTLEGQPGVSFARIYADRSGVVSHYIDGYEGMAATDVSAEDFDVMRHTGKSVPQGGRVEKGAPVYKFISSDAWSVVFPLTPEEIDLYGGGAVASGYGGYGDPSYPGARPSYQAGFILANSVGYATASAIGGAAGNTAGTLAAGAAAVNTAGTWSVGAVTVRFTRSDLELGADLSIYFGKDGNAYGKLDFSQYMMQFYLDRYVDFEIVTDRQSGLKIPIQSVTVCDFLLIPVDFLGKGGDTQDTGVYKETYTADGSSVEFVPVSESYMDSENVYIDPAENTKLSPGDYIVKPDSAARYQLGATASLKGVYNINKGYSQFRKIDILEQNDEFYTVQKNMRYGLSVYDHIVLDASLVDKEGMLVY